ncbi:MAG TPA: hypothetical protein VK464_27335, partial [Symbiobacteriaceae bacterium]|nr:hypothetical protein [Symbiobacteriaceae bacterium]
ATPAACGTCTPTGADRATIFSRRFPQLYGVWRPPEAGSLARPKEASIRAVLDDAEAASRAAPVAEAAK